jgi:DNA repair protein RadC
MTIRLKASQKKQVTGAEDMFQIMADVLRRQHKIQKRQEHCWVAALGEDETLLNLELVAIGAGNFLNIEATVVYSFALQKGAKKIIIIHNHPSGRITPSLEDNQFTEFMLGVGELVACPLYDHMIITDKRYFSYRESGKLQIYLGNFDIRRAAVNQHYNDALMQLRNLKVTLENNKVKLKEKDKTIKQIMAEKERALQEKAAKDAEIRKLKAALKKLGGA